ncbi:MAG: hypothetical protein WCO68_04585 [Verrucomicrobiota bacterium]
MNLHPSTLLCGALAVLALHSGCKDKQEAKVYSVEKTPAQATPPAQQAMPAAMPPGHPAIGPTSGGIVAADKPLSEIQPGTPPPQWVMQPPTPMRLASFLVKGENGASADISLIILGGAAGGVLDNVNRWQSQLGQPDLTADALAQKAEHLPSPLGEMTVVDLQGLPQGADAAKDGRILAAIVTGEGMTFFFKMRGNAELVGAQKADFLKWAGTVRFGEAKADAETKSSTPAAPASSPTSSQ